MSFKRTLPALAGAITAAMVLAAASPVYADAGDPVNCVQEPLNPACVIDVGTPGGSGGSGPGCHDPSGNPVACYIEGKGWYDGDWCWWQPATGDLLTDLISRLGEPRPPEAWYTASCGGPGNWNPSQIYALFTVSPGVQILAEEAVRSLILPVPTIQVSPPTPAPQVVWVPTWLWVDPAIWTPRSATASAGGLSVTATGTPTEVTWSTGDGTTVHCGPGTAWVPGTDPTLASPDCGHTYTTSSRDAPDGVYPLTATVTWQVTWTGAGTTGAEPALTSTATVTVRVIESAALTR